MKEEKDPRLAFMTINDTYVGIDVCDAKHPYGYEGTESFRKCIKKYLKMSGFRSIQQYMRALPGYSGKEKENITKPLDIVGGDYIRFDYDKEKTHPLFFAFTYPDSKRLEMGMLSFVNTKMIVHIYKIGGNDITVTMIPTLHKVREFFDVDDSELWFCKDWKEE